MILNYRRNTRGINLAKYVEMLLYPHLYLSNIAEKLSGFLQRKELVIKITWKSFALSSDADMIVTSEYIRIVVRMCCPTQITGFLVRKVDFCSDYKCTGLNWSEMIWTD